MYLWLKCLTIANTVRKHRPVNVVLPRYIFREDGGRGEEEPAAQGRASIESTNSNGNRVQINRIWKVFPRRKNRRPNGEAAVFRIRSVFLKDNTYHIFMFSNPGDDMQHSLWSEHIVHATMGHLFLSVAGTCSDIWDISTAHSAVIPISHSWIWKG